MIQTRYLLDKLWNLENVIDRLYQLFKRSLNWENLKRMACGELRISEIIHEAVTEILEKLYVIRTLFLQNFTVLGNVTLC